MAGLLVLHESYLTLVGSEGCLQPDVAEQHPVLP